MMQIMPSYYRIMAGAKSVFAQEFLEGGFIAANWNIEADQQVKGVIIALEDDLRIRRALSVAQNIEFYRYQLSFKLIKNS